MSGLGALRSLWLDLNGGLVVIREGATGGGTNRSQFQKPTRLRVQVAGLVRRKELEAPAPPRDAPAGRPGRTLGLPGARGPHTFSAEFLGCHV